MTPRILCFLFAMMLLFWSGTPAVSHERRRRCIFANITTEESPLALLAHSSCESCVPTKKTATTLNPSQIASPSNSDACHFMIVLSPGTDMDKHGSTNRLLNMASRILSMGHQVTLLYVYDPSCVADRLQLQSRLEQAVLSSLPCSVESYVRRQLTVHIKEGDPFNLCHNSSTISWNEASPYDALDVAESQYRLVRELWMDLEPISVKAFLADPNNVGALLLAEQLQIPIVMLAPASMLDLILDKYPSWRGLLRFLQQRMESFTMARRYLHMNHMRRSRGLLSLPTLSAYFELSAVVLVDALPELESHRHIPTHVHLVSPNFPICISCNDLQLMSHDNTVTVIAMALELSVVDTRTVIRGMSLARASLASHARALCDSDSPFHEQSAHGDDHDDEDATCRRYQRLAEFQVVWQQQHHRRKHEDIQDDNAEMLPSFVVLDKSSTTLEIVASYSHTALVVSHCDTESHVIYALDLPLLCLPRAGMNMDLSAQRRLAQMSGGEWTLAKSQDIANALLKILDRHDTRLVQHAVPSQARLGGQRSATLVQTLVSLLATGPTGNMDDMRLQLVHEFPRNPSPVAKEWVSTMVILAAWGILLLVTFYLVCWELHLTPTIQRRLRVPLEYLQTLDRALYHAHEWLSNENSLHNSIGNLFRFPDHDHDEATIRPIVKKDSMAQNVRRKKAIKKR